VQLLAIPQFNLHYSPAPPPLEISTSQQAKQEKQVGGRKDKERSE